MPGYCEACFLSCCIFWLFSLCENFALFFFFFFLGFLLSAEFCLVLLNSSCFYRFFCSYCSRKAFALLSARVIVYLFVCMFVCVFVCLLVFVLVFRWFCFVLLFSSARGEGRRRRACSARHNTRRTLALAAVAVATATPASSSSSVGVVALSVQ